ncbi:HAD-IIA family hydrolase [Pseudogracilibacillus sp. ICA-222130]|uniref:HAD-IIA family hydrolase n=1 Tax=Pseudogracilibacillus sp. ICA-222130 TaxID=3134655 RepID=UPI0030BE320B
MSRGYIFDLDGTIYLDDAMIDGANEAIATLKQRGDRVIFLTNKSISTRHEYVEKLNRMGIDAVLDEVINSNFITAKYLLTKLGENERVYVIGEQPLLDELIEANVPMTENALEAAYVVIGWDRQFTYAKINDAFQAWKNGAKVIATNPDKTCPVVGGELPDCAAMIGALEAVTGEPIELVVGKPSAFMANYVVTDVLQMTPNNCYMVGDRLETDIKMANDANINSVLVMTGITTEEMLQQTSNKPDFVLQSVKDIGTL